MLPLPQACSDTPCWPSIADLTLEFCCRLADAYKTGETDRLAKVDYRRFCQDMDTGEAWLQTLIEDLLTQCLRGEKPPAWTKVERCQGSTGLHACGSARDHGISRGVRSKSLVKTCSSIAQLSDAAGWPRCTAWQRRDRGWRMGVCCARTHTRGMHGQALC